MDKPLWYQKQRDDLIAMRQASRLWHKEVSKDSIREMQMDEQKLKEKVND